jgi:hypothetical protein
MDVYELENMVEILPKSIYQKMRGALEFYAWGHHDAGVRATSALDTLVEWLHRDGDAEETDDS